MWFVSGETKTKPKTINLVEGDGRSKIITRESLQ